MAMHLSLPRLTQSWCAAADIHPSVKSDRREPCRQWTTRADQRCKLVLSTWLVGSRTHRLYSTIRPTSVRIVFVRTAVGSTLRRSISEFPPERIVRFGGYSEWVSGEIARGLGLGIWDPVYTSLLLCFRRNCANKGLSDRRTWLCFNSRNSKLLIPRLQCFNYGLSGRRLQYTVTLQ